MHRDGFFVFGPMELKIGGVTLLRVLNQWFRRVFVIFDISVYSGSIMISDVPFSTISMDLKGFYKKIGILKNMHFRNHKIQLSRAV